jgi:hypothetical protein
MLLNLLDRPKGTGKRSYTRNPKKDPTTGKSDSTQKQFSSTEKLQNEKDYSNQVSISPTCLRAAFTPADPKSAIRESQLFSVFLRFWDLRM